MARTYREAFAGLPRDVWLLSGVSLVNRAGTMVLPFIALWLTRERGLSVAAAGALISLFGVGSALGSWLGGYASDRIGSERTLVASLAGGGALFLWLGFQTRVETIAVGILLLSTVSESFRPACMTAMAARTPGRLRVRAFALLRLALNLGVGVGPVVGGVLALRDYRLLFVADALTCWAAALLALRLPAPVSVEDDVSAQPRRRAGSPWRDGPFLLLLLLVSLLATSFFQIFSTLTVYLRDVYGLREDRIGLLLGLNAGLIVAFEMVLVHWAERRERMTLVGVGCLLVCVGFGLMPLGGTLAWAALTVAVWTVGEMLALPLLNAVVADRPAPAQRGRYMGLYTLAYSIAFIVAPALGTAVYQRLGPDALWYGVGGLGLPLFVGARLLRREFSHDPDDGRHGPRSSGMMY